MISGKIAYEHYIHYSGLISIIKAGFEVVGPVLMSHNKAVTIIKCLSCKILFYQIIEFTSNECNNSIIFVDSGNAYLKVMEHWKLSFLNNIFWIKQLSYNQAIMIILMYFVAFNM